MSLTATLQSLYRDRTAKQSNRVSFIELFFDLIFVFAVTQLSHLLLAHFTLQGALQTALLLLAVWWVWMYTSWTTNWLNPETGPVRMVMFILTALGLIMSTAIPRAFTDPTAGLIFAGCYVAMQVGRTLFMTTCAYAHGRGHFFNFVRVLIWMFVASGFWLAGGVLPELRLPLWSIAMFIEYIAPSLMFYVPGLGPSQMEDWDVDGEHMAERCGLFIIIALGESIVVMGESFSHLAISGVTLTAFAAGFISCVALWWLYFGLTAHKGTRAITHDALPGRLARIAYTYLHILLVGGIIVTAVGIEQVLGEATHIAHVDIALTILGGPLLYLLGNAAFIYVVVGKVAPLHVAGMLALTCGIVAVAALPVEVSVLGLGVVATTVLSLVAVMEPVLYRYRQRLAERAAIAQ